MLRSLYSGVAGLQVHQTKMDVIGNNISNVNTIGFKTSSVNFSDILYQTSQNASAATSTSGGTNAMQVGLGASVSSISSNVTSQGGAQRTDNALDLMINGDSFFVVKYNGNTYFTKNGAFNIDGDGNLATESGALVMGWQVDPTTNKIAVNTVSPLKVYGPENQYIEPEATTDEYFSGNIDKTDENLAKGKVVQMEFYNTLGERYTAKYTLKNTDVDGEYEFTLSDILNSKGESYFLKSTTANGATTYEADTSKEVEFGGVKYKAVVKDSASNTTPHTSVDDFELKAQGTTNLSKIKFNNNTGKFVGVGTGTVGTDKTLALNLGNDTPFREMTIDFSSMTMFNSDDGLSTMTATRGNIDTGKGGGTPQGKMSGIVVSNNGEIYGSYNNGRTKLLGQISVATFSNPAGLEAVGTSMYTTSLNSGDFDGIGVDITTTGGKFTSGVLEMSNVDLSTEFTNMVTTQRGFQANSRIITTSDTMLEELLNLKR